MNSLYFVDLRSMEFLTKLERLDLGCNELEDLVSIRVLTIWLKLAGTKEVVLVWAIGKVKALCNYLCNPC